MPESDILPPDQIGAALAGDLGGDVQAAQMKLWVVQYVDVVMGRIKFTGGQGTEVSEGLNQTTLAAKQS
jgi:hypothetical protein